MKTSKVPFSRGRNYRYFIDLVLQKARAGLRAEASRGYLGVLWWVIEPVIYMGVFYTVFAHHPEGQGEMKILSCFCSPG